MRIFKAILIVFFTILMPLGYFDFDVNAIWEFATSYPFKFAFMVIITGLFGFFTVNKFNTSDY